MKVYIGYEPRENAAYEVAVKSLCHRATIPLSVTPLDSVRLARSGLLRRPTDTRHGIYDFASNAPCATGFALSRFLVPILAQSGWALFTDCDMLFLDDVAKLLPIADKSKAVMVVQHAYTPSCAVKMDGVQQTFYARKNWSSVMLFNCDHPANMRLSLADVQGRTGRELHQFYWLNDSEIGMLPARWNWLVGEQPKPEHPAIAHYTLGGPFLPEWQGAEHDELWLDEARR